MQNALCYIIFRLDRMSHVTPYLKTPHWLPIQHCILFKYKLLGLYLSALIKSSSLTYGNRLSVSSTCPKKHTDRRGFTVATPVEWNRLPQTVRTQQTINGFRSQLELDWHTPNLSYTLASAFWILTHPCLSLDYPFLDLSVLEDLYQFCTV